MARPTVLEQCQTVAKELGLPVPLTLTDPGNTTAIQLLALWNALGQELYTDYAWKELAGEYTFFTNGGDASYNLPLDWAGPVDQTVWDRTNHWPLLGQQTAQQWQILHSGIVALGPRMRYRYVSNLSGDNKIELFPVPAVGSTPVSISVYYYKSGWVIPAGGPPTVQAAVADGDTTYFNSRLMINGTKLKLWEIKGFDVTTLTRDYIRVKEMATSKNQGAPVLSLSPRTSPMLIGPANIPDGNWQT